MLVSVFAAYALARKRFRGMTIVLLLMLATMMLPEEVIAIPLSLVLADVPLFHLDLIGTYAGMILPVGAWGFSILVMTEFMKEVPVELEEAARIDGGGRAADVLSDHAAAVQARARRHRRLRFHDDLGPVPAAADRGPRAVSQWTLPSRCASLRSDEEVGPRRCWSPRSLALLPSSSSRSWPSSGSSCAGMTAGAIKG